MLNVTAATHRGPRVANEDTYLADPVNGVYLVADGVGGYPGGEVASGIVREAFKKHPPGGATRPLALRSVKGSCDLARRYVASRAAATAQLRNMSTTLALLSLRRDFGIIAWVGDSRVYLCRGRRLTALTRDHSLRQQAIDAGMPTEDIPGNVITRSIGLGPTQVDTCMVDLLPGDTFLLCSDGMLVLPDDAINRALQAGATAAMLMAAALAAPATDNVTVVVVRL